MKELKEYIGYAAAVIMLCGWLGTVIYYGKIVKKLDAFYDLQLELNGKMIMYMEIDSK